MKVVKYVLFLIVVVGATLFFTLYNPNIIKGRKAYEDYFKGILKDPESFKVYNEEYNADGGTVEWKLDYGARNSFGGMVRKQVEFTTIGSKIYITESDLE